MFLYIFCSSVCQCELSVSEEKIYGIVQFLLLMEVCSFFFSLVRIQTGELGFIWAAASPSEPLLPPLLVDVWQHSRELQSRSQEQRHMGPEPSAPQPQPELCRRPLPAPAHRQIPHLRL